MSKRIVGYYAGLPIEVITKGSIYKHGAWLWIERTGRDSFRVGYTHGPFRPVKATSVWDAVAIYHRQVQS